MKHYNFIATLICFILLVLGVSLSTVHSSTWAQVENAIQPDVSSGNQTTKNSPAPTSVLNKLSENVTSNIKNETHSYTKNSTAIVTPGSANSTTVLCDKSDPLLSGGYSVDFKSGNSVKTVFIFANHPTGNLSSAISDPTTPGSGIRYFEEGWEAGLLNNGNETVSIMAIVLCAFS